jgi:nucleotide-binding universal stress UspA family protein
MFKQIVVGVDEHEGGRDAIALGKRLLARDWELTLAYVYAGDPHVYRSASAAYEASKQLACTLALGCFGRLIHGSTSQQLAHSARCPLLVLTRAARETETPEAAEDSRDTAVALKG